jgi:CRISPR-associated protein (TIGR02710 family)
MSNAKTVSELTDEWIALLQSSGEETALGFYCEYIMPELLPTLRKKFRETYGHEPHYDGLISLLGFAPDTVILASQFVKPETLVVLHTEETKDFLDRVYRYANIRFASFHHEAFSEVPNTDIYRALEAALKRFPKGSRIAIELTGGKKTMSGALAIASGLLDIDLMYIDYSKYMPEFRKPRPESTYIQLVGNPLKLPVDLFSEVEINRAVDFFNVGKYDISRTLFEQASQRMANPRVAEVCTELSRLYMLWNAFAFQEASELCRVLSKKIIQFYEQTSSTLQFDFEKFEKQAESLNQLSQGNRISLLWNFYFSAERYHRNNQSDIAALLYYRTLESIFENSIKDLSESFNTENPDYSIFGIDIEELLTNFISFRSKVFKEHKSSTDGFPSQIGMFDSLCLLGALNQPIAQKITLGRVANIAKIRNRSVYAHGIRPIDT